MSAATTSLVRASACSLQLATKIWSVVFARSRSGSWLHSFWCVDAEQVEAVAEHLASRALPRRARRRAGTPTARPRAPTRSRGRAARARTPSGRLRTPRRCAPRCAYARGRGERHTYGVDDSEPRTIWWAHRAGASHFRRVNDTRKPYSNCSIVFI